MEPTYPWKVIFLPGQQRRKHSRMSRKGQRSQKSRETVTWRSPKNRKQRNQKMRNPQRGNLTARIRRNWSWTALTMKILQNLPLRMLHLPGRTVRKNISRISVCIPAMALRILWRSAAGKIWMKLMAGKPIPLRSDPVIILPDFM